MKFGPSNRLFKIYKDPSQTKTIWISFVYYVVQPIILSSLPSVRPEVFISLDDPLNSLAAKAEPRAGGAFKPTGEWSCGHPVFSDGALYLCCVPGDSGWSLRLSPDDSDPAILPSGLVIWGTPSPRAVTENEKIRSENLLEDLRTELEDLRTPGT